MVNNRQKEIAASSQFRFIVGHEEQGFSMHSALVKRQSPALERLVCGNFTESSNGTAIWKDVDEDIFISFWQFVYRGDYEISESLLAASKSTDSEATRFAENGRATDVEDPKAEDALGNGAEDSDWTVGLSKREKLRIRQAQEAHEARWAQEAKDARSAQSKRSAMWDEFKKLDTSHELQAFPEASYPDQVADRMSMILHHAKVYIFADCYGISDLMTISLRNVHRNLVEFVEAHGDRIHQVTRLLKFFSEECAAPQRLQDLVVRFVACNIGVLSRDEDFKASLRNSGEIATEIIAAMVPGMD